MVIPKDSTSRNNVGGEIVEDMPLDKSRTMLIRNYIVLEIPQTKSNSYFKNILEFYIF